MLAHMLPTICYQHLLNNIQNVATTAPVPCFILEPVLKGSFTIFLFSVRTHILDTNEVWYSRFWSEGSINALNPNFLGFYFVPRDLESRRHMGPRVAAAGTSSGGGRDLEWRRQGTSTGGAKGTSTDGATSVLQL